MADTPTTPTQEKASDSLADLASSYKNLSRSQLAEKAVDVATNQLMASSEFKKPRIERLSKYWRLYDGKIDKKLRQLFNVPIPVFPGMIDTLNSQYDTPITMKFKEGDPSDYFKVQKIDGAFRMEIMDTSQNSKWDSKLSMGRKHAIMNGRAIFSYFTESDPEYKSNFEVVNLKNFHFQPRGGLYLENHLFAGEENIQKTAHEIAKLAEAGIYDKDQAREMLNIAQRIDYLPNNSTDDSQKLSRFKPLGLNADNHTYVGQSVFQLAQFIVELDGKRWYLLWHPWSKKWLRFEPWEDICSSGLYPWVSYATHEDDENFLSKAFADDIYPAADSIVTMFNQELTNREKRNFGSRAYDKDMFPDARKLDEAMLRPDGLVAADTKGGTRRIAEGVYEFKVGELAGTVNLIDWITGNIGRNTGATDLASGSVQEVSKKASVTFAEQKSVSKRISWYAQPFQTMMSELGKRYIFGLKDDMPSKMAIRTLGENGWDWDEITRMDLDTAKDIDVLIESTDKQMQESDMRMEKRKEVLAAIGADPLLAGAVSPNWRAKQLLEVGEFEEYEIAEALDVKSKADRKSLAKASEAIQLVLRGKQPDLWYGANIGFIQKIVDYAKDHRTTLGPKFEELIKYALAHTQIAKDNIDQKLSEEAAINAGSMPMMPGGMPQDGGGMPPMGPTAAPPQAQPMNPGVPPAISHAMNVAASA